MPGGNKRTLGLGLGLNPNQRAGFRTAAAGGQLGSFLGKHDAANTRFGQVLAPGKPNARTNTAFGYINQNNAAASPGANEPAPAAPNPGGIPPPATAGGPGATAPPPVATGTPPTPAPPTFQDIMNNQFGAGNPFGDITHSSFDELAKALQGQSDYGLKQNLGDIRSRYGNSGAGISSREALAEGAATGKAQSDLNATLAQTANQNRQAELDRALQAIGLGANTTLGEQNNANQFLSALTNAGLDLSKIAGGDLPKLIDLILPIITNFGTTTGQGFTR